MKEKRGRGRPRVEKPKKELKGSKHNYHVKPKKEPYDEGDSYLLEFANLTGIMTFLNENYIKMSGNPFTLRDVKGYCEQGKLPQYLGGNAIVTVPRKNCTIKLYNISTRQAFIEKRAGCNLGIKTK